MLNIIRVVNPWSKKWGRLRCMKERDEKLSSEENAIKLSDYLNGKRQEMVDLYTALYDAMKDRIPDLYEVATQSYITFRNSLGSNIAEVRIQSSQIKINITEQTDPKNRIGEFNNDSYNWSKNYKVYCKKFDDVGKVSDAIFDSYQQMV